MLRSYGKILSIYCLTNSVGCNKPLLYLALEEVIYFKVIHFL